MKDQSTLLWLLGGVAALFLFSRKAGAAELPPGTPGASDDSGLPPGYVPGGSPGAPIPPPPAIDIGPAPPGNYPATGPAPALTPNTGANLPGVLDSEINFAATKNYTPATFTGRRTLVLRPVPFPYVASISAQQLHYGNAPSVWITADPNGAMPVAPGKCARIQVQRAGTPRPGDDRTDAMTGTGGATLTITNNPNAQGAARLTACQINPGQTYYVHFAQKPADPNRGGVKSAADNTYNVRAYRHT